MKPIDRMCPACKVPPGVGCLPFGVKPGCGYPMKGFHWERRNQRETKIAYPTPRDLQDWRKALADDREKYVNQPRVKILALIDRIAMLEHKLRGEVAKNGQRIASNVGSGLLDSDSNGPALTQAQQDAINREYWRD